MEGHGGSLTGIATVALAALACGMLARAVKQPSVMGYIIAGALLGPSALGIVKDRENIQLLAEFGVLMLLYLIGMELSLRAIREVWKVALVATLCQIVAGLLVMLLLGFLANWEPALIVLLGCVVALSSTAVAIKMMEEIGELRTRVGQITIGILVAQDLAVVPMMLIVGSFGSEGGIGLDALLKVALSVGFLALLIIYLLRRQRLRLPFIHKLGEKGDLIPLAGLGLCFGGAALSGLLGLSAAYGAFLAGLIIGNSTSRRVMIQHTEPIQAVRALHRHLRRRLQNRTQRGGSEALGPALVACSSFQRASGPIGRILLHPGGGWAFRRCHPGCGSSPDRRCDRDFAHGQSLLADLLAAHSPSHGARHHLLEGNPAGRVPARIPSPVQRSRTRGARHGGDGRYDHALDCRSGSAQERPFGRSFSTLMPPQLTAPIGHAGFFPRRIVRS
jgi:hypothetical protein